MIVMENVEAEDAVADQEGALNAAPILFGEME